MNGYPQMAVPEGVERLLAGGPFQVRIGARGARTRHVLFVVRIPGWSAFDDAAGNPAPFGDLAIVGADPVDGNGRQAALFTVAGEAKPAGTVLGGDGPTTSGIRPTVAEYA